MHMREPHVLQQKGFKPRQIAWAAYRNWVAARKLPTNESIEVQVKLIREPDGTWTVDALLRCLNDM